MEDNNGTSWEMTAVRQFDGSVRGFKVGEECPYYESDGWTYAKLSKNEDGEYAILESWESAYDDFTIVMEFGEFGSQNPQKGKKDQETITWNNFVYVDQDATSYYG